MNGESAEGGAAAPSCPQFRPEQLNLPSATPLGAGAISHVVRSTLSGPSRLPIAVKIVSKLQVLKYNKVSSVMNERAALIRLGPHPFIARLYGTCQSEDELYFVLEWLPHGDLLQHIRRTAAARVRDYAATHHTPTASPQTSDAVHDEPAPLRPIPVSSTTLRCLDFHDVQLITAQLVLGLARVFECGFVLRDLKPENVAFDSKYRACLLDFDTVDLEATALLPESNDGVALAPDVRGGGRRYTTVSEIQSMRRRTASFCGTAQYVSPEMVGQCKWSYGSDLWALGAVVYEMVYGVHMFSGLSCFEVLQKVIRGVSASAGVAFPVVDLGGAPDSFARVKDFILSLMSVDPHRRLGVHPTTHAFDLAALQRHPFFDDFDWSVLETQVRLFRGRGFEPQEHDADDDCTPSLHALYHRLPSNDESYADYVYRASADANPFERFMKMILLNEPDEASEANAPTSPPPEPEASVPEAEDEIEVIDDVGMHYNGFAAPDDFQH